MTFATFKIRIKLWESSFKRPLLIIQCSQLQPWAQWCSQLGKRGCHRRHISPARPWSEEWLITPIFLDRAVLEELISAALNALSKEKKDWLPRTHSKEPWTFRCFWWKKLIKWAINSHRQICPSHEMRFSTWWRHMMNLLFLARVSAEANPINI